MNTDRPGSDAPAPLTVDQHSALRREMLAGLMPERDFDEIDLEAAAELKPEGSEP